MTLAILLAILAAYLIGSVPNGYLVVKLFTGQDLTQVGSGRTGGTNAMRASGLCAGFFTGAIDILKGAVAIGLARWLVSGQVAQISTFPWVEAAAGVAVVIGHNWSLFLSFRGGAGTGPNVGAAIVLLPYAGLILPPFVPLVLFATGYASVASLCTAILIPFLMAIGVRYAGLPWEFVGYGLATCGIITWALRTNIAHLYAGTERRVSLRAIISHRPSTR
jgi:glycerol-3-phosphate acyltransferase PlsY